MWSLEIVAKKATHVDSLWEEAKAGSRKLTAPERRRVLVYLSEIGETKESNVELAKLFKVTETVIRQDKQRLLREMGKELTPQAQVMIVAAHLHDLNQLIITAKRGQLQNESGTLNERFYVETLMKLYKERRETYENVGVIRKELGTINVDQEHWVATADTDTGTLGVHQVSAEDLDEQSRAAAANA
jgi:hypothetical protein